MNKIMKKYMDIDVVRRRKSRFRIWSKSASDMDREILRVLAIHEITREDVKKPIKKSEVFDKMFELYEDYLSGACPAIRSYFNKKYEKKA